MRRPGLEQNGRQGRAPGRERNRTLVWDAGDRLQVFVDGFNVVVGHFAVGRPRHNLENITVEGGLRRSEDAALGAFSRATTPAAMAIFSSHICA